MRPDTVWLLGYPVALGTASSEHVQEWAREFALMALSGTGQRHDVPERLRAMVGHVRGTFAHELSVPERLRAEAFAAGRATVDLPYPAVPEAEQTVRAWQALLAEVDAWCAAEALLTLQRPPELVALDEWVVGEFLRQLAGEPPRPWPGLPTG